MLEIWKKILTGLSKETTEYLIIICSVKVGGFI